MKARGTFTVTKWDEEPLADDSSLSRASISYEVAGDINGQLAVEYVLHYTYRNTDDDHDAIATFTGYEVFTGDLMGKKGSFVLVDNGSYDPKMLRSDLLIKPETGTGELTGIIGSGFFAMQDEQMVIELEYNLQCT